MSSSASWRATSIELSRAEFSSSFGPLKVGRKPKKGSIGSLKVVRFRFELGKSLMLRD